MMSVTVVCDVCVAWLSTGQLRATTTELQIQTYRFRATFLKLQVQSYRLRATGLAQRHCDVRSIDIVLTGIRVCNVRRSQLYENTVLQYSVDYISY